MNTVLSRDRCAGRTQPDYVMNGHYTPGTFEPNLSVWASFWVLGIYHGFICKHSSCRGWVPPLNGYTFILYEASGGPYSDEVGERPLSTKADLRVGGFVTNKAEMSATYLPASSRDLVTKGIHGGLFGTNKVDRLSGRWKWVEMGGNLNYKEVTDGFYFNVYIFRVLWWS